MKNSEIINKLSLEEKATLCSGKDYWHLEDIPHTQLKSIMTCDGPYGLRKQNPDGDGVGLGNSYPATCFPTGPTTACAWDPDIMVEMGEAIGEECLAEKVSVLLGPSVNMHRSPLCGRNFEYFSEDPLVAGELGASFINGLQSKGVGASVKHFAVNSQEARRMVINEVVDERSIREIFLPAFETIVKKSQPWTVMNAYNRLNGVYCSLNSWLQQQVLRDEWGFKGLIVTDWGASVDCVEGLKNGTDLVMPSTGTYNYNSIIQAAKNGELDIKTLDERVDNIIELVKKGQGALNSNVTFDKDAHHALAEKIAASSAVLLKNDDSLLPLSKDKKIAVIGDMAKNPRFQGAGSALINPIKLTNAFDSLTELGVNATFSAGYITSKDETNDQLISQAVEAAKNADVAIVFIGLIESYEAEGYDRAHMLLPAAHNRLVDEITKVNENVVIVLSGGSAFSMPWLSKVKAVLHGYLGGEAGGGAIAKVLTGDVTPSGKLSETYPIDIKDNPTWNYFPGGHVTTEHREGLYIGYRYYDTAEKEVLFPFGFGLSYTSFEYSDMKLSSNNIKDTDTVEVSFKIKNTGKCDGAEIAQIYVSDKESTIFRPKKELRAFKKVFLKVGEEKQVTLPLSKRAFAFYNVKLGDWQVESGGFDIMVCASVSDIKLCEAITVTSDVVAEIPDYRESAPSYYTADVMNVNDSEFEALLGYPIPAKTRDPKEKLTVLNNLSDAENTKWGKRVNKIVDKFVGILLKKGADGGVSDATMIGVMATQIPIRNFISMSMGVFSKKMADGLLKILNDEAPIRGIFTILGGLILAIPKIPKLIKAI